MTRINYLSRLPSVDRVLSDSRGEALSDKFGRVCVAEYARESLASVREQFQAKNYPDDIDLDSKSELLTYVMTMVEQRLTVKFTASLRSVFNLTGTVLHTNLGRAPLPEVCLDRIREIASGACNLEFDLDTGRRGDRDAHVEQWICEFTGADAATVVNNNAAAVLLTLNTLALDQHVAVSRGELVEIGGSFRIPDVMSRAGCHLMEIGTTNRSHTRDYLRAIENDAVALMKVHTSNYVIEGFTAEVQEPEIAKLGIEHDVITISDLGSGCLVDLTEFGLPRERTVEETIRAGIDVVTFSGDKLLGGPQCGVIAGKKEIVERIKNNPMKRALRCDKLILAAFEAVLELYANPTRLKEEIPAIRLLMRSEHDIQLLAESLIEPLTHVLPHHRVEVAGTESQIGSGAVPVNTLPGSAVRITPLDPNTGNVEHLSSRFRSLPVPVIGRIQDGSFWMDMRCLEYGRARDSFVNQLESLAL